MYLFSSTFLFYLLITFLSLSPPSQARLKLEQERKEAELLAEKQEILKKKREEKRLQREAS